MSKNISNLPGQLSFFSVAPVDLPSSTVIPECTTEKEPSDYEKICDFENIYRAHMQARCGKQHKKDVITFELNLSDNLCKIQESLENHTYRIKGYKKFMIYDPKEREIQALSYYDRIVQHVLCDSVLRSFFEKRLIYDNCACRIGKGTHFALNRLTGFLRDHYKKHGAEGYILKCDVKKYFASIHHDVLKAKIIEIIPDKDILNLLLHIIDSFEHSENRGLPMGNQTSQLFALYYLDQIDRLIKEKLQIKHYVRYMDDMVLVHNDREYLKECLKAIKSVLETDLKLSLNSKTQIFHIKNGVDFLGFHFYLTDNGKVIRKLRRSSKIRFKNRLKHLKHQYKQGKIDLHKIRLTLGSYSGHLRHGHTYRLKKHVLSKFALSCDVPYNTPSNIKEMIKLEYDI